MWQVHLWIGNDMNPIEGGETNGNDPTFRFNPDLGYYTNLVTNLVQISGIIFMAKGLNLISCKTFNFTSLNIDELFKRER